MTLPLWLTICGYTASAGALVLIACAAARPGRFGSRRCPGPRCWWRSLLRPIYTGGCGYDLRGLPAGSGGTVRCPECARQVRTSEALGPAGLRWIRLGVIAFCLGALGWTIPIIKTGAWVRYVPTPALAVTAQADVQPPALQQELRRRLRDNELPGWAIPSAVLSLTRDLRDDDIPWNGMQAMNALRRLGPGATTALERALSDPDPQQRLLAACLLRDTPGYRPSARMLAVVVEGLASDVGAWDEQTYTPVWLGGGVRYLAELGDQAAGALEEGMRSGDAKQRFACAVAAGFGQTAALVDLAAPILIEHLADNAIRGDARLAAPALLGLGQAARPWLDAYAESADLQQRDTVRLILLELDGPAATYAERIRRSRLNHLTRATPNPVAEPMRDLDRLWLTYSRR